MRWNLGELRDHVRRVHGEDQLRIVNSCLRTVGARRQFSRYHFNEAMRGIDAFRQQHKGAPAHHSGQARRGGSRTAARLGVMVQITI
jgi:DNA topoisomerase IB